MKLNPPRSSQILDFMVHDSTLLNDWHPVMLSQDIQAGTVKPTHLLGEDLVLWRHNDQILAWQDWCPHRGARLSLGWVEENTLVCPYHGLAYNSQGQCIHIPAHPDLQPPTRACVRTYQTQERYGLVWVSLGNPTQDIPSFPEWDEPSYRPVLCGPYHFNTSGCRAIENFLDVAHFPFVHGDLLGDREALLPRTDRTHSIIDNYQVEVEADGITLRDVRVWQPNPDGTGQGGSIAYNYRVLRPLTAYFSKNTEGRCLTIFLTVTPVEEEECIAWMWMAMNHSYEIPEVEQRAFQDRIVAQDIPIVESQRPKRLPLDLQAEFHLPCDRASIAYRKWLKQLGVTFGTIC
jgi:phenylpropionate dioxygenase-like ring-hydroxylating dioxygenase large terminal subunit